MRHIMAIYDVDPLYAARFADVVNQTEKIPFDVLAFSSFDKLKKFAKENPVELLLISSAVSREEAEDAVQESFIKAYKALDSFRGESGEKTWLYAIAMNVCRDMRRTAWYRYVDRRIDFEKLPMAVSGAQDTSIALMTEVMRLPRKYMEAVWLYYYEDMGLKEVGQMLGVSPSAVSRRLEKAKTMLRSVLKGDD